MGSRSAVSPEAPLCPACQQVQGGQGHPAMEKVVVRGSPWLFQLPLLPPGPHQSRAVRGTEPDRLSGLPARGSREATCHCGFAPPGAGAGAGVSSGTAPGPSRPSLLAK